MQEITGYSLLVLGRQPALSLVELESLYGADKLRPVGPKTALADLPVDAIDFSRLGGSTKLCRVLTSIDTADWSAITKKLISLLPELISDMPEGKIKLGISTYGLNISVGKILATGLTIKKIITKTGRSVRLVPNKDNALNTASVFHNKLLGNTGREIVIASDGTRTFIALTARIQDIASYAARDRDRPKRDAKVGMLPPKLAQIIINLAAGRIELPVASHQLPVSGQQLPVLDPFCGSGVILQEALLMGYGTFGTDIDTRMVEYSKSNLSWLEANYKLQTTNYKLASADATSYVWSPAPELVASETYLGRPFTSQPNSEIQAKTISECNLIIKKFLRNIYEQTEPGFRMCIAVPAWKTGPDSFKHLPLLDILGEIGYNRVKFEHVSAKDLLYYREDQIVARELLVLTRK